MLIATILVPSYCQWEEVLDKNQIQVYTKAPDSNMFHYKSVGTINGPIDSLYHFLTNFSFYPNWVNYCSETELIDSIPDSEFHYYCHFDMPWPARNRYAIVHLKIEWSADSSIIKVNTKASKRIFKPEQTGLQISEFREYYSIEQLSDNKVRFTMQGSYNPKGTIPLKWITKMLKWGPYDTLIKIRSYIET